MGKLLISVHSLSVYSELVVGILEPSVNWPLPPTSSKSQPPHTFTVCSTQREALAILCGSVVHACLCLCSHSAQKVLPHHQASLPPPHLSSSPAFFTSQLKGCAFREPALTSPLCSSHPALLSVLLERALWDKGHVSFIPVPSVSSTKHLVTQVSQYVLLGGRHCRGEGCKMNWWTLEGTVATGILA